MHHPQRVVEGEGVRLLNRREVLEGRRPLGGGRLRAVQQVDVMNVPLPVGVGRLIGPLVRVGATSCFMVRPSTEMKRLLPS